MQNVQTITVEITHNNAMNALHNLEAKHFIRIVEDNVLDSPSLPEGERLGIKAFKSWISDAENMSMVSLKSAKAKWTSKRKQLQRLTR